MGKKRQQGKDGNAGIDAELEEAEALLMAGRGAEAMKIYQLLLGETPDHPGTLHSLGILHHRRGELQDAEYCFRRILHANPRHGEAMIALALVCADLGLGDEAQELAQKGADFAPLPRLLTKAGLLQQELGYIAAARKLFERAIKADPAHIDACHALSALQNISEDGAFLKNLSLLGENAASLPDPQRIKLEFALGKACLDTGRDAEAFAHYAEANRLKRASYKNFSIENVEKYVDVIIELFSEERVSQLRHVGAAASARPVFITGMPRSGVNLVKDILAGHPRMAAMPGLPFLQQSIPAFANAEVPGYFAPGTPSVTKKLVDSFSSETLDGIARKYLQATEPFARHGARLADRSLGNVFWIGVIRLALPHAAIIHCTRDPMSIGLSVWQGLFAANIPWAYDLTEIGRYYNACEKLMAHWHKVSPGDIHEANYESLVLDPEKEIRRLLEYCGLPWDEYCQNRSVRNARADGAPAGLHKDSIERWKNYATFLQPLSDSLKSFSARRGK